MGRFERIDSRLKKEVFLANRPSRKWISARIGRESREFECESERRRDSRESGQVFQKCWCANRLPTKRVPI